MEHKNKYMVMPRFYMKRCFAFLLASLLGIFISTYSLWTPWYYNRVASTLTFPMDHLFDATFGSCSEIFTIEELDLSNGYLINIRGTLPCVIHTLNQALSSTRNVHIASPYSFENSENSSTLLGKHKAIGNPAFSKEPYFEALANYPQVYTIILRWKSIHDKHLDCGLPVKAYYMCKWPADNCNLNNMDSGSCANYLNVSSLLKTYSKPPSGFYSYSNPKYLSTKIPGYPDHVFIHLVKGAILDNFGNVATSSLDLVPFQCQSKGTRRKDSYDNVPLHEEVFVISQYWGEGFYHSSNEDLPRIVPFLEFLLAHSNIKVHVIKCCGIADKLEILGIDRSRLVWGYVRVRLAYVPNGGGCGWLNPLAGPMLAARFREHTERTSGAGLSRRNKIVLIQRSSRRWLAQHREILAMLKSIGKQFALEIAVFSDKQLPGLHATMALFYQALIVVAPHGAGLSNIMFSQPGTAVIEIVKNDSPGCYRDMMQYLGHPYVGLLSDVSTPAMHVDLSYLRNLLMNVVKAMTATDKPLSDNFKD